MKTLRKGDEVQRVKDTTPEQLEMIRRLVDDKGWSFCDKTTWRRLREKK